MTTIDTPRTERPSHPRVQRTAPERPAAGLVQVGSARKRKLPLFTVPRALRRWYGPIFLVAIWSIAVGTGLMSEDILSTPWAVVAAGVELIRTGVLQENLLASFRRVLGGLAIGIPLGISIAVLAGLTRKAEDLVDSSMQVFKAIPSYALVPLLMIWLGIGETPKVTLIAIGVTVQMYINTYGAIRNVDSQLVEAARTLDVGRWGLVRHVIIPGSVPGVLVGLRMSLANAWLGLIFAETINAPTGLGSMMSNAASVFRTDIVVLIVVIYAIIGLLSYAFVRFLTTHLLAWRQGYQGE